MGPDLGLLLITLLGLMGVGVVCLALLAVGALMAARALAERLPVRAEGTPWPVRRTTPAPTRTTARRTSPPTAPQTAPQVPPQVPREAARQAPRRTATEAARAGR
ncbi:hypothetical protein ACQP1W_07400 [Spirillospora sp. CA-255316]